MRHHGPIATVLLSALFGALLGFVACVVVGVAAVMVFVHGCPSQEEMSLGTGVVPREGVMITMVVLGTSAGAFFGWRLARRRQTDGTAP